jgi:hypothetical protein
MMLPGSSLGWDRGAVAAVCPGVFAGAQTG